MGKNLETSNNEASNPYIFSTKKSSKWVFLVAVTAAKDFQFSV
jgi:hypothetical protein